MELVDRAFDRALQSLRGDPRPLTVLFSGGVDSSVIADSLRGHPHLELLTVGTEGCFDIENGRSAAELLQLPWRAVVVGDAELAPILARVSDLVEGVRGASQSVAVSLAVAMAAARTSRVVTAQGVDELFLGYAHFRGITGSALEARYREDLSLLADREWPRAVRIAERLDRELHGPFLDRELRVACESIPLEVRATGPESKPWFRRWAERRGLPPELAHRPKKALQFGSGIDKLLRAGPALRPSTK